MQIIDQNGKAALELIIGKGTKISANSRNSIMSIVRGLCTRDSEKAENIMECISKYNESAESNNARIGEYYDSKIF